MARGNGFVLMLIGLLLTIGMSVPASQQSSPGSEQRTYKSPDGTSQFTYPSSYRLHEGGHTVRNGEFGYLTSMSFCEGALECVECPANKYAGTNLVAASFYERESDDGATESTCLTSMQEVMKEGDTS